jgi:translation initiation factor IF-2
MSDTKTPGEKKLTLSLKPRTETGVVRQSFSHGRSKQVVVEVKKRRTVGGPEAKPEPAPAEAPKKVAAAPVPASKPPEPKSGVVLRTLTEDCLLYTNPSPRDA